MNLKLICVCVIFLSVLSEIQGYRILVIFNIPSKSHFFLGNAYAKALAEAGHDVTMISPYSDDTKLKPKNGSYREIVLTGLHEEHQKKMEGADMFKNPMSPFIIIPFMSVMSKSMTSKFFNHEAIQEFLKADEKFDVIVVEQFMNDAIKALGHKYNAHVVAFSNVGANAWTNLLVSNPSPLAYIPYVALEFPPQMNLCERVINFVFTNFMEFLHYFVYVPLQNQLVQEHIPGAPHLQDIMENTSLVLLNSHESYFTPVPQVPSMVNIGGFHLSPPKKLPKDLQQFLDSATDGVIYFSMGSNLKSNNMPDNIRDALLKTFAKLKQKVLWKWDGDELPGQPSNVKLAKWLPQQDLLAHPNVKVFMTHGGLLSTIETVYHGVPIVAIPIFGDQKLNAKTAEVGGYGLTVHITELTEESMTNTLNEILTNPKYYENVQKRSKIMKDRLTTPVNAAVYWTEYVVRHEGARHLRVAGVGLPFYKHYSLDVLTVIAVILIINFYLTRTIIRCVVNKCQSKKKVKQN